MVNLTEILYCPITHLRLLPLKGDQKQKINAMIGEGKLRMANGNRCKSLIEDGLIREDNGVVYEIKDNIPVMLPGSGIVLEEAQQLNR